MQKYDFYKLVEKISVRTGMYVRDQTLSNVAAYLAGYEHAMIDAGIKEVTSPDFAYFKSWLKTKYRFNSAEPGWMNMILALAVGYIPGGDLPWDRIENMTREEHLKSIRLFFEFVEEYKNDEDFATRVRQNG